MVVLAACGGRAANVAVPESTTASRTPDSPSLVGSSVITSAASSPNTTASDGAADSPVNATSTTSAASDRAPDDAASSSAPPVAPQTPAGIDETPDQDVADASVLRVADIPGWTLDPATTIAAMSPPRGCAHVFVDAGARHASARATLIAPDGAAELTNEVSIFATATAADSIITRVDRRSTPGCLETMLIGGEDSFTIDRALVDRDAVSRGDNGVAYDAELEVSVDGTTYQFAARFEFIRVGRAISFGMAFGQIQTPDEAAPALDAVLRRLDQRV
jgi:hypothetical protein